MSEEKGKRIGELNGKWAILFRFVLSMATLALPAVVSLQVWEIKKLHELEVEQTRLRTSFELFSRAGGRYTPEMAKADNLELKQGIWNEIEKKYPPEWLRQMVESHGRRIETLERSNN